MGCGWPSESAVCKQQITRDSGKEPIPDHRAVSHVLHFSLTWMRSAYCSQDVPETPIVQFLLSDSHLATIYARQHV
eukprot:355002-Chlamydomonas_euryale.AAC.1